uniref:Serine protease HTRA2, mitochondrial n=1 Tax=Soboliphyme baturini TaxID=241478 RepID=A0A183IK94_9BILA
LRIFHISGCSSIAGNEELAPPHDLQVFYYLTGLLSHQPYSLVVNITWQPPFDDSLFFVTGFNLYVVDMDANEKHCFQVIVGRDVWTVADKDNHIKFWFSVTDLFVFRHRYYIGVQTLPKSLNRSVEAGISRIETRMPEHPGINLEDDSDVCSETSHPDAHGWVTAFNLVDIQSWTKSIFVEFVAAPLKYCFSEYEIRLMDVESRIVRSAVLRNGSAYAGWIGNYTVSYVNYTFENVTPGVYSIGVIPIETDDQGRCLCQMPNKVCSCTMAVFSDIRMPDVKQLQFDPCDLLPPIKSPLSCYGGNATVDVKSIAGVQSQELNNRSWLLFGVTLITLSMVVCLMALLYFKYFQQYFKNVKMYLIPNDSVVLLPREQAHKEPNKTILLIYAHDCPQHDFAVKAFANYLQSVSQCTVVSDFNSVEEISRNKSDWMIRSLANADKVVVVHSVGSYVRYGWKVLQGDCGVVIQRKDPVMFDDLFLSQLDMFINQRIFPGDSHAKPFVSVRFTYTPKPWILPYFAPYVCYEVPAQLQYFVPWLFDTVPSSAVEQQTGTPPFVVEQWSDEYSQLKAAVEGMQKFVNDSNNWFEETHVKRRCSDHFSQSERSTLLDPLNLAVPDELHNSLQFNNTSVTGSTDGVETVTSVDSACVGSTDSVSFSRNIGRVAFLTGGASATSFLAFRYFSNLPRFKSITLGIPIANAEKADSDDNVQQQTYPMNLNFVADVVEKVAPAVVYLEIVGNLPFVGNQTVSNGSGVIVRSDGLILTNAHVVGNGRRGVEVKLQDGRSFPGEVCFIDPISDLATVKIKATGLPALNLGTKRKIRPGEWVIALGSPFSLTNTVTVGVISNTHRKLVDLGQNSPIEYIQTDAMITFGNSGGPLVNLDGDIIGINTMQVMSGISFAVPADYAKQFLEKVDSLEKSKGGTGFVSRAVSVLKILGTSWFSRKPHHLKTKKFVGLNMLTLDEHILRDLRARDENFSSISHGVLVHGVIIDSPAHQSGIEPGDIIIEINNKTVYSTQDVLSKLESSEQLVFTIIRRKHTLKISVFPEVD